MRQGDENEADGFPSSEALWKSRTPFLAGSAHAVYDSVVDGTSYFLKIPLSQDASESGVNGEIAAKRTADLLGLNFSTPPVVRRNFPDGEGVVSRMIQGTTLFQLEAEAAMNVVRGIDAVQRREAILFDFVIGNADRNEGNVLVEAEGSSLIDHESAYAIELPPAEGFLRRHALALRGEVFDVTGDFAERLIANRERIVDIAREERISEEVLRALSDRLDRLESVFGTMGGFDRLF